MKLEGMSARGGWLAAALLAGAAGSASAQVLQVPGYCIRRIPVAHEITGIAHAPGGAFGDDVYLTTNGLVLRVDLDSGGMSTFATGLTTGTSRPSGAAFDTGVLGTGHLYVIQNLETKGLAEVHPDGSVVTFSAGGTLYSCNDVVIPEPGGPFGSFAYVTNGTFNFGAGISRVAPDKSNAIFHSGTGFKTIIGLDWPKPGSAFGSDLFVGEYTDKLLYRVASNAATAAFPAAGPAFGQIPEDLAFGTPGGAFGDFLYVTTADTRKVVQVSPTGASVDFVTGLQAMNGYNGDLAFTVDGEMMLLADGLNLVVISKEPWVSTYCVAKTSSCGTQPAISATGMPSATATSGFVITATGTKAQKFGLLLYTDRGPASLPFQGGTLCLVSQNLRRSVAIGDSTGTPPQCDGTMSIDMNAFAQGLLGGNPAAYLKVAGTQINCQFWGRDTLANGSLLSDAVVYGICL